MPNLTRAQAEVLEKMKGGWEIIQFDRCFRAPLCLGWQAIRTRERQRCECPSRVLDSLFKREYVAHHHDGFDIHWDITPSGREALKVWREKQ